MTSNLSNEWDNGKLWVVVEAKTVETKPILEGRRSGVDMGEGFGEPDAVSGWGRCRVSSAHLKKLK